MAMLRLYQLELPFFRPAPPAEEHRHIQLGARIVEYRLLRSRRRTLGMSIDQRGLRVGASLRTPLREVEHFLRHNTAWVLKKLDEWHGQGKARRLAIHDGASVPVLGEECRVRVEAGTNRVKWHGQTLVLQARPGADLRQLAKQALRGRALEIFTDRASHYAARMHRPVPPLALSSAHTRWGSCSEASGVRLSWRLVHSPLWLIDYVVVHELAHLVEMNHSSRFWAVVEKLYPEYRAAREELKKLAVTCPQI
jgi:predicted metal-dependent hydrolase